MCNVSAHNSRQAFSYHIYCILLDSNGQVRACMCICMVYYCDVMKQPLNNYLCDGSDDEVMKIRIADTERMGNSNGVVSAYNYSRQMMKF